MKKFLLVMMALCLTFAMISCGGDSGSSSTPKVTITYDVNSGDADAPPAPELVKIKKGGKMTEEQLAPPVDADGDPVDVWTSSVGVIYEFQHWYRLVAGVEQEIVPAVTTFSANTTIYAKWKLTVPTGKTLVKFDLNYDATGGRIYDEILVDSGTAIGSTAWPTDPVRATFDFLGWFRNLDEFDDATLIPATADGAFFNLTAKWSLTIVEVTFNYNYAGTTNLVMECVKDSAIPARDWPVADRPGYAFNGWFAAASGGTALPSTTTFGADRVLYAQWGAQAFGTGSDFTGAERVFLENGAYVIYKFDLAGTEWQEFEKVTVDFAVDAANLDIGEGGIRGARLLGMYKAATGPFNAPASGTAGTKETDLNGVVVLRMNAQSLNNYIIDNALDFPSAIVAANTWSKVTYDVTGANKHGDWNAVGTTGKTAGVVDANADPELTYDGVLFVAVGITRGYAPYDGEKRPLLSDGFTQWIKNVTLVPYEDSDASPILATKPAADEPQFVSYIDPVVHSWRGDPDAVITVPSDPTPVPPVPDVVYRVLPYPSSAANVVLGAFTWDNSANQKGWRANGTDGNGAGEAATVPTDLDIKSIVWAKSLVLVFAPPDGETSKVPAGGCQMFWQTDTATGWNSRPISANSGYGTEAPPAGVTYDAETRTVTIEFAKFMSPVQYYLFVTAQDASKFGIQYYGPSGANWSNIALTSATLIMDDAEQ